MKVFLVVGFHPDILNITKEKADYPVFSSFFKKIVSFLYYITIYQHISQYP